VSLERLRASAIADRYRIERELGQGGMATVYLAEDVRHRRRVALKVLKPELAAVLGAERFVQEITTTAALQHPHILPLFDSGTADGFLFYVMPFIDGETLRAKLDRETQLGIDEAVRLTTAVADALDYAHRRGVIHRDIKPENILLHEGRPVVADFGIALAVSAAAGGRMTETGLSLGTPHYMSPEQATAEKEITARSDVYSLGSVLYEMLTGNPPHTGASAQQVIMKIVTEEAAPVTKLRKAVPPNVAAATARALEKLPADRFATASEFAGALADPGFRHGTAGPGPGSRAAPRARHRDPAFLALGLITIASLAVAAWAVLRPPAPGGVARYSVRFPEGLQVTGAFARFALTPDGRRLIFTAGTAGERDLWIRDRDQLEARRVPGTAGAYAPFVSPDGGQVGFLMEGGLRVASLDGSVVRTLADTGIGNAGGTWGRDGMIYVGRVGRSLVRIDATGSGRWEPFTTVDTAAGERHHTFPDALPNGKGVLFTMFRRDKGEEFSEIGVARTADGSHRGLVRGVYARYAASGHLLYATAEGTLMAAPFDQGRMELTGPGAPVATNLTLRILDVPDLAIARDGTLLYSTGGPTLLAGGTAVWVRRDGTAAEVDPAWSQLVGSLALSPDGARLAVTMRRTTNLGDLWVRELARGAMSRLTSETNSSRPTWTPDGQEVLYFGFGRDGIPRGTSAFRQAIGTTEPRLLFEHPLGVQEVFLSRDSTWLVYRAGFGGGTANIYARRLRGDTTSLPVAATGASETAPTLSPDGRWLAFVSNESGGDQVYVQAFPDAGGRKWPVSTAGGTEPLWSRNGLELFYRNGRNEMVAVAVARASTPPIGEQRVLFPTRAYATDNYYRMYDVTPDGQRFVMLRLPPGQGEDDLRVIVVQNFFEELERLVPR
jgi:eukaryotic-like serine/threonine-protein kinase